MLQVSVLFRCACFLFLEGFLSVIYIKPARLNLSEMSPWHFSYLARHFNLHVGKLTPSSCHTDLGRSGVDAADVGRGLSKIPSWVTARF